MSKWWHEAIYDTCSLITLDKMFVDDPDMESFFPTPLAIEESFTADKLDLSVQERMLSRCKRIPGVGIERLTEILSGVRVSIGMSDVDRQVCAAAVQYELNLVTGDKPLAKNCLRRKIKVGNIATILRELVLEEEITPYRCSEILFNLSERGDYFLTPDQTQNWESLKDYRFP